jgi:hypothetical protein
VILSLFLSPFYSPIGIIVLFVSLILGFLLIRRYKKLFLIIILLGILVGLIYGFITAYLAYSICANFDATPCTIEQSRIWMNVLNHLPFVIGLSLNIFEPIAVGTISAAAINKLISSRKST